MCPSHKLDTKGEGVRNRPPSLLELNPQSDLCSARHKAMGIGATRFTTRVLEHLAGGRQEPLDEGLE